MYIFSLNNIGAAFWLKILLWDSACSDLFQFQISQIKTPFIVLLLYYHHLYLVFRTLTDVNGLIVDTLAHMLSLFAFFVFQRR